VLEPEPLEHALEYLSYVRTDDYSSARNVKISGMIVSGVYFMLHTFGLGVPKNDPSENSEFPCESAIYPF
jgi:hypothetical protein